MTLERGTCSVCGRDVALRKGGLVREHEPELDEHRVGGDGIGSSKCRGSGFPSRELVDAAAAAPRGRPRGEVPAELADDLRAAATGVLEAERELEARRVELARVAARTAVAGGSVRSIAAVLGCSVGRVSALLGAAE